MGEFLSSCEKYVINRSRFFSRFNIYMLWFTNIQLKFVYKVNDYSCVLNKRAGPNKRAGWNFDKKLISVHSWISVQGGILLKILKGVQGENWQFYSFFVTNERSKKKLPENKPSFSQKNSRLGLNIWQKSFKNPEK